MHANFDHAKLLQHARAGRFCDTGHYHCPRVLGDGTLVFRAGVCRPDGSFEGAARLAELLQAAQAQDVDPRHQRGDHGERPLGCPGTEMVYVD